MSNTGALTQVLLGFSLTERCQTFIWWWILSDLWKALQCGPRWLLKSMFQMHCISMTDGCQMSAQERAEKGTILTCFCLTRPLDPQEKADTWCTRGGGVPGEARLNTEPQEHLILTHTIFAFYVLSQIMRTGFLHTKGRKAGRRGKPGCSHLDQSWVFGAHKSQQNPLQKSQWELLLGQMQHSEVTSLLVKGCSGDGDKGAASLSGSCHAWRAWPSYRVRLAWRAPVTAVQVFS